MELTLWNVSQLNRRLARNKKFKKEVANHRHSLSTIRESDGAVIEIETIDPDKKTCWFSYRNPATGRSRNEVVHILDLQRHRNGIFYLMTCNWNDPDFKRVLVTRL